MEKAMETVETLHSEGVNVAVTPTISQKNLDEIVDITAYFTKKGIPVWYSLYSYDTAGGENQLFKIGKENDEFTITDKQGMVNVCNALIEMKKKNSKILITKKLLKTLRDFYAEDKRDWHCMALKNFFMVDPAEESRVATATTTPPQSSTCQNSGKAKNSTTSEKPTATAKNATTSATSSTASKADQLDTSLWLLTSGKTLDWSSEKIVSFKVQNRLRKRHFFGRKREEPVLVLFKVTQPVCKRAKHGSQAEIPQYPGPRVFGFPQLNHGGQEEKHDGHGGACTKILEQRYPNRFDNHRGLCLDLVFKFWM